MTDDRRADADPLPDRGLDGDAVRPVAAGRTARSAQVAVAVAVVAIAVMLVKPWDLVPRDPGAPVPGATPGLAAPSDVARESASPSRRTASSACAAPPSWRAATIESWAGRIATVWSAAEAATGDPDDPDLPFEQVITERLYAIGWCAPVAGPDRPPLVATGRLLREGPDGFRDVAFRRIAPDAPSALGELWAPVDRAPGPPYGAASTTWEPGRYVIVLSTGTGWERLLGIQVRAARVEALPEPSSSPGTAP